MAIRARHPASPRYTFKEQQSAVQCLKERVSGLESTSDRRSGRWHGNQHVCLRHAEI